MDVMVSANEVVKKVFEIFASRSLFFSGIACDAWNCGAVYLRKALGKPSR